MKRIGSKLVRRLITTLELDTTATFHAYRNRLPKSGNIFAREALETMYDFDEKKKFGKKMVKNNYVNWLKNREVNFYTIIF